MIRKIRILILLSFLILSIILAFFSTLVLQALVTEGFSNAVYDLGRTFLTFGLTILISISQFGITTFLLSRGNNLRDSILFLIVGESILSICLNSLFSYIFTLSFYHWNTGLFLRQYDFSLSYRIFNDFFSYYLDTWIEHGLINNGQIIALVSFIFAFLLGVAGLIYAYLEKEPSGERAGRPGPNNLFDKIVFNSLFCLLPGYITEFSGLNIIELILLIVFYFGVLILYYHTIHFNKKTWITFIIISSWSIIYVIILGTANTYGKQYDYYYLDNEKIYFMKNAIFGGINL